MTCIVGLVTDDGNVLIGADSLSSNHSSKKVVRNPKIIRLSARGRKHRSDILIGYTSSWRMGQILGKLKAPDDSSDDAFDYLSGPFVDGVRQAMKDGGFATVKDGAEAGGYFLVAYDGRLFGVQSDFSVLEAADGFDSVGSGEDWAMGSLFSTRGVIISPEDRVLLALKSAEAYNPGVQSPFHLESLIERAAEAVA